MSKTKAPRIILAGGGTGGHVFPAVAVAQALKRASPQAEVLFVGTERGLESRVLPQMGYALKTLTVRHLKGSGALGWARGLGTLPLSAMQALGIVWGFGPDVVVSVGGYAAGPVTMLAALMGKPTVLLEQNAYPGMTNRLLSKVVRRCYLSLPDRSATLPADKCQLVGNPLRQEILDRAGMHVEDEGRDRGKEFRILITGGSGGAGPLNKGLPRALRQMDDAIATKLVVCHQAGRNRAQPVWDDYRGFAGEVEVVEFIDDMAKAYGWADLVICRSGATTLAELLVLGQPSMLIPFAGAADNHQEANALSVVQSGAAVMVREEELNAGRLERLLEGLVRNPSSLDRMGQRAAQLGKPEAADVVAQGLLELAGVRASAKQGAGA